MLWSVWTDNTEEGGPQYTCIDGIIRRPWMTENDRLARVFWAESWADFMQQLYDCLGWGKYRPMEMGEPTPELTQS